MYFSIMSKSINLNPYMSKSSEVLFMKLKLKIFNNNLFYFRHTKNLINLTV